VGTTTSLRAAEDRLDDYHSAAEFFGLHPGHVRRLVSRGELPTIRLGRRVRFRREDLIAYAEAHRVPARGGAA
jgi:excisionase family DNA binding protein